MARAYWLMKSEPFKYPWEQLVRDGSTYWDGVRNYEARNNLAAMKKGDLALFYHSNEGKEVVGIAKVVKEAYPDPTAPGEEWSVVDVAPHKPLKVADKPAGEWNHFEIKLEKGLVTVHLNGELVLDKFECKFRKPTGPLVLQHHGTPLWFKNIYLKDLK